MRCKLVLGSSLLVASAVFLTACGGTANSPSASTSSQQPTAASSPSSPPAGGSSSGSGSGGGTSGSSSGGSGSSSGSGSGSSGSGTGSGSGGGSTTGGFAEKRLSLPAAGYMQAADFNRDGRPDLLIYGNSLQVLINNGSGNFQNAVPATIPSPYTTLTEVGLADFNGDSFLDVVACANDANGSGAAVIYLNDGTGKLSVSKVLPVAGSCQGIAAGDANRDGKADVAVAYYTGTASAPSNAVVTWFGDGTGNFTTSIIQSGIVLAQTKDASSNPCGIQSAIGADFDQNGTLDLILFGACQPNVIKPGNVYFARGDGSGHYVLREIAEGNTSVVGSPFVQDIDGDGRLDFLYINGQFGPHGSTVVDLMFAVNGGSGTFAVSRAASENSYAGSGSSLTAGSSFGSGLALIGFTEFPCCSATSYGVKLVRTAGGDVVQTWTYGQSTSFAPGEVTGIASGDFDGNGTQDFAAVESDANHNAVLHVYLKSGS